MYFFIFISFLIDISVSKQTVDPDQMLRSAASDLGLHCLPRSQKWNARLIWDKIPLALINHLCSFTSEHSRAITVLLHVSGENLSSGFWTS